MLNPHRALLLACLAAAPAAVGAASRSSSFVVRARVLDACTISAVAGVASDPDRPAVTGHCTPATPYRIEHDAAEPRRIDADKDEPPPVQTVTVTF